VDDRMAYKEIIRNLKTSIRCPDMWEFSARNEWRWTTPFNY
jgi:hypothetical protein